MTERLASAKLKLSGKVTNQEIDFRACTNIVSVKMRVRACVCVTIMPIELIQGRGSRKCLHSRHELCLGIFMFIHIVLFRLGIKAHAVTNRRFDALWGLLPFSQNNSPQSLQAVVFCGMSINCMLRREKNENFRKVYLIIIFLFMFPMLMIAILPYNLEMSRKATLPVGFDVATTVPWASYTVTFEPFSEPDMVSIPPQFLTCTGAEFNDNIFVGDSASIAVILPKSFHP